MLREREWTQVVEAVLRCDGYVYGSDADHPYGIDDYIALLGYAYDTEFPLRKGMVSKVREQRAMLAALLLPETLYSAALAAVDCRDQAG